MPGRGESAHVEPDLGEDDLRVHRADAGNLIESFDRASTAPALREAGLAPPVASAPLTGFGLHCGQQLVDAGGERADLGVQRVDLIEQHPRQFGVVIVEPAGQRLDQSGCLGLILPRASSASRCGSRSPAISASSMSRTDSVSRVEATDDTLISASSSSFSSRCQYRERSRVRSIRSRV